MPSLKQNESARMDELEKARRYVIAAKLQAEYPGGVRFPCAIAETLSVALDSLNAVLAHPAESAS